MVGKDEPQTARGRIREAIKNEIFTGKIAPSEVLVVDDLAKRFGVSRTPVREALLSLASNGLLDAKHHVGFIVTPVNAKEIIETYSLRILLERESVQRATRNFTPEGLKRLRTLADDYEDLDGRRFHSLVAANSGWGVLAEMLELLMDKTARSRALFANTVNFEGGRAEDEKFDHRMIYAAIAAGEGDEAASLMEMHLREAQRYILKTISTI